MTQLILIRGLPGSGKTTLARTLAYGAHKFGFCQVGVFAADDYFTNPETGEYIFDAAQLPDAHEACRQQLALCLRGGNSAILHNTFSRHWEMRSYLQTAKLHKVPLRVTTIDLFDGGLSNRALARRCTKPDMLPVIAAMRQRWEHGWEILESGIYLTGPRQPRK